MLYSWNHKYVAFSDLIFALSNMDWSFLPAFSWNFPGGLAVKNMPANVGDAGSIPGLGRSPGEGNSPTHSSILAWEIPWTEAPGYRGYSPWGHKESDMTLQLSNNNNYNNAFSWPDSSFFFFFFNIESYSVLWIYHSLSIDLLKDIMVAPKLCQLYIKSL